MDLEQNMAKDGEDGEGVIRGHGGEKNLLQKAILIPFIFRKLGTTIHGLIKSISCVFGLPKALDYLWLLLDLSCSYWRRVSSI